ncbi:unnamed protein product [Ectocarpus fasciculatus]
MIGSVVIYGTYALCVLLHLAIPVMRYTPGYCCDQTTFQPLQYRLNGLSVLIAVLLIYAYVLPRAVLEHLYTDYWSSLIGANILGIGLSAVIYIKGGSEKYLRCLTTDQISNGRPKPGTALTHTRPSKLAVFFLGRKWNPRYFGIDCKMFLYIVGAVGLACNILSCVVVHLDYTGGHMSNAMCLYTIMFFWFIAEYMYYEYGHIYTYDLFAEKVGFKLVWGCLVFYPYFYAIGCFNLVQFDLDRDLSVSGCLLILLLFFSGWCITRGANLQKYEYRVNPKKDRFKFLFGLVVIPQRTLSSSRLLISGWWGVARHFNYFGEIVQALALAIPGVLVADDVFSVRGFSPLLYPLYYVILFVTRVIDDDAVCRNKYGKTWEDYCSVVSWRICPGVW